MPQNGVRKRFLDFGTTKPGSIAILQLKIVFSGTANPDSYEGDNNMLHHLQTADFFFEVSDCGARICALCYSGRDVLQRCSEMEAQQNPDLCGGFPLLPLANRVQGNAYVIAGEQVNLPLNAPNGSEFLHGFGWQERWQLVDLQQNSARAQLTLLHEHLPGVSGYDYRARLYINLYKNQFVWGLQLQPLNNRARWYGLGFHPYFAASSQCRLQFKAVGYYPETTGHLSAPFKSEIPAEFDFSTARALPARFINHCYLLKEHGIRLNRPDGLTISMQSPATT